MVQPDEVLTTVQVCKLLGISRPTLYSWVKEGRLRPWKTLGQGATCLFLRSRLDHRRLRKHSRVIDNTVPHERPRAIAEICVLSNDQVTTAKVFSCLGGHNFHVSVLNHSSQLEISITKKLPDMIVLDIDLTGLLGWSVLADVVKITEQLGHSVPILVVSGKFISPKDSAKALRKGAWDFLRKSSAATVFSMRIRSLLRRKIWKELDVRGTHVLAGENGHIRLDLDRRMVELAIRSGIKQAISLTRKESELLCLFLKRPGQIFSKVLLLELIWGCVTGIRTRTVDCHIKNLRQKLGSHGSKIKTHYGIGYEFENSSWPHRQAVA